METKILRLERMIEALKKGDLLVLQEFDGKEYTGLETRKEITYVLDNSDYLQNGYVVLGIK
ncbi:DUF3850 domain-containing protein [Clostridioides difficile]|nr:DUF3850 domain-containing protein [Clostridioides difficile]